MKESNSNNKNKIWFARWAKTPWAVFRSLGVVVHIQDMSITAFKDTLLQQPGSNKNDTIRFFTIDSLLGLLLDWDIPWEEDVLEQTVLLEIIENNNMEVALSLIERVGFPLSYCPCQSVNWLIRTFFIHKNEAKNN